MRNPSHLFLLITILLIMLTACGVTPTATTPTGVFSPTTPSTPTVTPLIPPGVTETATRIPEPTFPPTSVTLQEGNENPKYSLQPKTSGDLADNRIGAFAGGLTGGGWKPGQPWDYAWMVNQITGRGVKRFRVAIDNLDAGSPDLDWSIPQNTIDPSHDTLISLLAKQGITMTYVLTFWDKDTWPGGTGTTCPRFKTQAEVDRYLNFVRYIVHHFKDRIQQYEIWNEPNNQVCPQWIEAADYIHLVRQAVPVIRQEFPEAKIAVGATSYLGEEYSQAYLFEILNSDVMPLVDIVSWHPMYGTSPEFNGDYYSSYPALVQKIKDTAAAQGFTGTYEADELTWFTLTGSNWDGWSKRYSEPVAAKYTARGLVRHLGMDVNAGIGSVLLFDSNWTLIPSTVQNLATVLAGAEPADLPVQIATDAQHVVSYSFALPNGDGLLAVWTDGIASEEGPGVSAEIILPGQDYQSFTGFDVLTGFKQELVAGREGEGLALRKVWIKDYPILILLSDSGGE